MQRRHIDNLTRSGRDSEAWSGGNLTSRETNRARSVRVVFLSLEGTL